MKIPPPMLKAMIAHARESYPSESCGIVIGTPQALSRLSPCRNIQDELHEKDPETYPRSSRDGYSIHPEDMASVMREARERGEDFRVIYHSHVDTGAYFSEEDKRVATWEGEPTYPEVAYVVISVVEGEAKEANIFRWNPGARDFEGESLDLP
ncbi:MAG: Mov34/MPN/PAD-1 family protein [Myxococcota bacterium]